MSGQMTVSQARIALLQDALDQAISTITFLHGCLTEPETFEYAYPEQTTSLIDQLRELVPDEPFCPHSKTVAGCPGCAARLERFERRARAQAVIAADENSR